MIELTCSCCGNHVSLKTCTVKETVDIIKSGWGSYGSALYCPECTKTWHDRNITSDPVKATPAVPGRWIDGTPYTYHTKQPFGDLTMTGKGESCSECGWVNKGGIEKYYNFCPNCGAKMNEKEIRK